MNAYLVLFAAASLCLPMSAKEPSMPTIAIDAEVVARVDPRLFGMFLERPTFSKETGPEGVCDAQGRLPETVISRMATIDATIVRFPGGTGVDYDDWTDLISNAPGRENPGRPVTKGYQGGEYTNRFGLDEFLALQDRLGFQPLLVVNLRDAVHGKKSLAEAARHAAGMLAYCTRRAGDVVPGLPDWGAVRAKNGRPEPTRVPVVAVGNETWFFWPLSPEEKAKMGFADDTAVEARLVEILVAYAEALRAVDPTVELIVDGLFDPWNPDTRAGNQMRYRVLMHPEVRRHYQYVSVHQYAPLGMWTRRLGGVPVAPEQLTDDQVWYGLQGAPGIFDMEGRNRAYGDYLDALTAVGYRVAATEWNWNGWDMRKAVGPRPFTEAVPAALGAASYLHGLVRQAGHTAIGCQSMFVGHNWNITAVRATPGQAPFLLPMGQVMALYAGARGDRLLRTTEKDLPGIAQPVQFMASYPSQPRLALVDAVVLADDHQVHAWLIHRQRNESLPLRLTWKDAAKPSSAVRIRHLSGNPAMRMGAGDELSVSELKTTAQDGSLILTLPPASITTVTLDR